MIRKPEKTRTGEQPKLRFGSTNGGRNFETRCFYTTPREHLCEPLAGSTVDIISSCPHCRQDQCILEGTTGKESLTESSAKGPPLPEGNLAEIWSFPVQPGRRCLKIGDKDLFKWQLFIPLCTFFVLNIHF